jgi:hypothetical protein
VSETIFTHQSPPDRSIHARSMFSLKDWQRAALARMLAAASSSSSSSSAADAAAASASAADADDGGADGAGGAAAGAAAWSDDWKVLVLDAETRAIVAPLLSVGELRSLAVTLHLALEAPRDRLPDVSAVYFVRPTPENVAAVANDAAAGMYRDASVHFSSPVPRAVLEAFAGACVERGCVARVRRVWDQHLAFVSLEPRLFSLGMPRGFAAYQSLGAGEESVRAFCHAAAVGLLSVFGTTGAVPVIVFARGGPAMHVAHALDELVRDHLASPGLGAFGAAASGAGAAPVPLPGRARPEPLGFGAGARPVLLLLDRNVDLVAPLAHSNTYQSLVDDAFGPITHNRIVIPDAALAAAAGGGGGGGGAAEGESAAATAAAAAGSGGFFASAFSALGFGGAGAGAAADKRRGGKTVYLDSDADPFWRNHASDDFQRAVDSQASEARDAAAREAELKRRTGGGGGGGSGGGGGAAVDDAMAAAAIALGHAGPDASAADLTSAIHSLPELNKRKEMLKTHQTVLLALMHSALQSRCMHEFSAAEAGAAQGEPLDRAGVLRLCADASEGRVFDDRLRLAAIHLLTCPLAAGDGVIGGVGGVGGVGGGGGGSSAGAVPSALEVLDSDA